jgi:hypothetical protein
MKKLFVGALSVLALTATMSGAFARGHYPADPPLGPPGPIAPTAQRQYKQDLQLQQTSGGMRAEFAAPFYSGRQ